VNRKFWAFAQDKPVAALCGTTDQEVFYMAAITGTVKFFNTTKGFGFISPDNGEKDAFVHISAVQRSGLQGLYEGDKVSYELQTGRDGKVSAAELTLLS